MIFFLQNSNIQTYMPYYRGHYFHGDNVPRVLYGADSFPVFKIVVKDQNLFLKCKFKSS